MIQITDKEVFSDAGKYVHRKGTDTYFKRCSKLKTDTADKFEEVDSIPEPKETINYNEEVNNLIRTKYSLSEELAILRQKEEKPDEYREYFDFCEKCKTDVKAKLQTT